MKQIKLSDLECALKKIRLSKEDWIITWHHKPVLKIIPYSDCDLDYALNLLARGEYVRREAWPTGYFIYIELNSQYGDIVLVNEGKLAKLWIPAFNDLIAKDWISAGKPYPFKP